MPSSSHLVAKSIIEDKKYLLYYHRFNHLLRPKVMPILLEVEHHFNEIPPLSITREKFNECLVAFESLLRKVAGYSFYLSKETVKEGFKDINYHAIYSYEERREIGEYIYLQHENLFLKSIEKLLLLSLDSCPENMKKFFDNHLSSTFSILFLQLFKDVFIYYLTADINEFHNEYIPNTSH